MQQRIYLDHAATTPLHPQVIHLMHETMLNNYGNPRPFIQKADLPGTD